jgi:hypothetical protein
MSKPIYKVFLMNLKDTWHELTPEEQKELGEKVYQALKEVGGERVIACESAWCSENYLGWGVEKFPDIEAVHKHAELLSKLNHYKYIDSTSYLGTEYEEG